MTIEPAMSFFESNILTSSSLNFDERQWIKQICQTLDEDLEEESTRIPITIFGVPKALMMCSPDSYIPHQVAVGPYHHLRSGVYDMERYKVAAAKRIQKELQTLKLQDMVDHLIKYELQIRANYHRPLNLGPEALAWMMTVDACFLFEFIQVCGVKIGKVLTKVPSRVAHLIDLSRNKHAHNAILRDIVMLENQIPLFVMRMLLEFQFPSLDFADQLLIDMVIGLCNEISPFTTVKEGSRKTEVKEFAHILDFMYRFIVPKVGEPFEIIEVDEEEGEQNKVEDKGAIKKLPRKLLIDAREQHSSPTNRSVAWMKMSCSRLLQVILTLPWMILSRIPIFGMLKELFESIIASAFQRVDKDKKDDQEPNSNSNSINNIHKPPLLDEITIPSVTELSRVGVRFSPAKEGIASIDFEEETLTLYIPTIELDENSDVILRNLVAYEACSNPGMLVLTRFTELMNGIIDTEEDAQILCERGIIINRLKSVKEVSELWNGMSRSIRLTKVPCLDRVIEDVNKYYNGRWKVKFGNFMKRYVFGSWRILTFLASIVLLLLVCLQAFCQVYGCSKFLPSQVIETPKP